MKKSFLSLNILLRLFMGYIIIFPLDYLNSNGREWYVLSILSFLVFAAFGTFQNKEHSKKIMIVDYSLLFAITIFSIILILVSQIHSQYLWKIVFFITSVLTIIFKIVYDKSFLYKT